MIIKKVAKNCSLLCEIEHLSIQIDVNGDNKRHILFAGLFRVSLTHYHAINTLIEKRIYTSALALVRVLFDSVVRSLYLYYKFNDEDIDKTYEGEAYFPKTDVMCKKLDKVAEISFFEDIRDRVYFSMCDYTHTGAMQITQNLHESASTIESNFSDKLILDTLEGIEALVKVLALHYFEALGLEEQKITKEEIDMFLKYINTDKDEK